jgi:tetratricopeptide (TPR) repeat protein
MKTLRNPLLLAFLILCMGAAGCTAIQGGLSGGSSLPPRPTYAFPPIDDSYNNLPPLARGAYIYTATATTVKATAVPGIHTSTPTKVPDADRIKATISALATQEKIYVDHREAVGAFKVARKIIDMDPDNAELYLGRAHTALLLSASRRNIKDFMETLRTGLAYTDRGIALDPHMGDLYAERALILTMMGSGYPKREDRFVLYRLALDNAKKAISLGAKPEIKKSLITFQVALLDCSGAVAEAIIQATQTPHDKTYPTTLSGLSYAFFCKGDYQKALDYLQEDIKFRGKPGETFEYETFMAVLLYDLDRKDEALKLMNDSIKKFPYYFGGRYFIRATIEMDRGEYNQALNDAHLADVYTWDFGMYKSYFEGLMALRNGENDEAIKKFQYFESTNDTMYDFAMNRARDELEKLGAKPLVVTPSVNITATPIPADPDLPKVGNAG